MKSVKSSKAFLDLGCKRFSFRTVRQHLHPYQSWGNQIWSIASPFSHSSELSIFLKFVLYLSIRSRPKRTVIHVVLLVEKVGFRLFWTHNFFIHTSLPLTCAYKIRFGKPRCCTRSLLVHEDITAAGGQERAVVGGGFD